MGTIQALDGSSVSLGGKIRNGTLTTSGTGVLENIYHSNLILDSVNNTGNVKLETGTGTYLKGTINNSGTISLNWESENYEI